MRLEPQGDACVRFPLGQCFAVDQDETAAIASDALTEQAAVAVDERRKRSRLESYAEPLGSIQVPSAA